MGWRRSPWRRKETRRIELGIGVIPLHTRDAASIAEGVRANTLPLDRLLLGVGSPNPDALKRVRAGVAALRSNVATRIIVAALGPQMCRLAGEVADGVLFNWLTPEHARRSAELVRAGAASAGRPVPRLFAYVRLALGPAACERLAEEGARYAAIPAYGANFARMGVKPVETAIGVADPRGDRAGARRVARAPSTRSCCAPSPRRIRSRRTWRSSGQRRWREAGSPTGRRALRRQTAKRVLKTRRIRYGLAPRW